MNKNLKYFIVISLIIISFISCNVLDEDPFTNPSTENFYKNQSDLSEKIIKISSDEKLRKTIAKNGKMKYMKHFNSNLVAQFIINKTLGIKDNKKYYWCN